MFFLSQNGETLVESSHLYIKDSGIFAVISGGDDILLAKYYDETARDVLRQVSDAIADSEEVFSLSNIRIFSA